MSDTVTATLCIELNVTCPHCDHCFDLVEHENLNDDSAMIRAAIPDRGDWGDHHKNFREHINCPECYLEINVKGIYW